jgi:acetyl-CoA carboxylase carboxyltransferase component
MTMDEDKAQHLAELEVKRNRTLADLEAVQAAGESVKKSMDSAADRQKEINDRYTECLQADDLSEEDRKKFYREWHDAFCGSVDEYNEMAAERERLHVQEVVLVRMIVELDYRIREAKKALS